MRRPAPSPTLLALSPLLLLLAACGGEAGSGDPPPPETSTPAVPAPDAAAPGIPLGFVEMAESGVTGLGRLVEEGESSLLVIELEGLPGEGEYAAHVHNGSCGELGGVALGLLAVRGNADGTGSSSTTFGTADLPETQLAVQVHGADGSGIACADIHRH